MADYASIYAPAATRIRFKWFKSPTPTPVDLVVPGGANWARVTVMGCGGQGGAWGGGAALARAGFAVTPGETLKVYVGTTSTAGTPGDSYVQRPGVATLAYSDRGRGVGTQGQASFSVGDVRRSGAPGGSLGGGVPGSDAGDQGDMGFGGIGFDNQMVLNAVASPASDPGGGGQNLADYDTNYEFKGFVAMAAGTGQVCVEFYSSNPGY